MASAGAGIIQAAHNRAEAIASFRALPYIVAPSRDRLTAGHAGHEQAGGLDWSTSSLAKVREDTEAALRDPRDHASRRWMTSPARGNFASWTIRSTARTLR